MKKISFIAGVFTSLICSVLVVCIIALLYVLTHIGDFIN